MPNFDDDWPIPAYLTWYKSDNTKTIHALNKQLHDRAQTAPDRTSQEKAESFAYKASINIQQSIQQWEYTATCLFISRNSPFPKSLWLHQFLNNPNSFGNELHQGDYTAQRQHFDNACHFEDEDNQEDDLPGTLTTALIEQSLETITSKPNANTHYTSICSNTTKRYPGGYWSGYDDENEQSHIKQEESIQDSIEQKQCEEHQHFDFLRVKTEQKAAENSWAEFEKYTMYQKSEYEEGHPRRFYPDNDKDG
jgi:hypothetical protein